MTALRFFFTVTLDRPETTRHLAFVLRAAQATARAAARGGAAAAGGAAGAEVQGRAERRLWRRTARLEVVALKVADIDCERMLLRVEQGKGRKDRFAMLSPQLLELLRDWYRIARPQVWLFPGRDPALADDDAAVQPHRPRGGRLAGSAEAGVAAHVAAQLCHPPAEQNIDIRVIQVLLGHAKLDTTARYAHVATNIIRGVMSPLDRLTPLTKPTRTSRRHSGRRHGPSRSGGRGHLPRPRARLA